MNMGVRRREGQMWAGTGRRVGEERLLSRRHLSSSAWSDQVGRRQETKRRRRKHKTPLRGRAQGR